MAKKSMSVAAIKAREYRKKLKEPGNEEKLALSKQKDKERQRKYREKQLLINSEYRRKQQGGKQRVKAKKAAQQATAVSTNKQPIKSKKTIVKEPVKRLQTRQPDVQKNTKRIQSKLPKHPVEPAIKKPAKSMATGVQKNANRLQTKQPDPAKSIHKMSTRASSANVQKQHQVKTEFPKNRILSIQENVKFLQSKLPKEPREAFEVIKSLGKSFNLHFYTVQTMPNVKKECQ